jgi:hypothetical protein
MFGCIIVLGIDMKKFFFVLIATIFFFSNCNASIWVSSAARDYNTGTGFDFNYSKITPDANIMPVGDDIIHNNQDQAFYDQNLIAYWRLDRKTSTQVFDDTNNAKTGTFAGGADINAWGMWDSNAFWGDGIDNQISFGTGLNIISDGTWSAWVYPRFPTTKGGYILYKQNGTGYNRNWGMSLQQQQLALQFWRCNGTNTCASGQTDINTLIPNAWNYVAVTDNSKTLRFYVNGDLNLTSATYTFTPIQNTNTVLLGFGQGDTHPERRFDGYIDEVKIYNRALSANEIQTDYNSWMKSNYYSPIKDSGTNNTIWNSMAWNEITDKNNSLTLDYRGCQSSDCNNAGAWITGLKGGSVPTLYADGNRYLQYRINLDTNKQQWNPYRTGNTDKGQYAKFNSLTVNYTSFFKTTLHKTKAQGIKIH